MINTTTTKENAIKVIEHINSTFSKINVLSAECLKLMEKRTEEYSYDSYGRVINKTRTYYIHTDESEDYYAENITPLRKELQNRSVEGTDYVMEGITVHRWGSGNYNKIRTWKMVDGRRTKATRNELLKATEEEKKEEKPANPTTHWANLWGLKSRRVYRIGHARVKVGDTIMLHDNQEKHGEYEALEKVHACRDWVMWEVLDKKSGEKKVLDLYKSRMALA